MIPKLSAGKPTYAMAGMLFAPTALGVVGAAFLSGSCVRAATPIGMLVEQLKLVVNAAYCPHGSYGLSSAGIAIFASLGAGILLLAIIAGSVGVYAWMWAALNQALVQIAAAFSAGRLPQSHVQGPAFTWRMASRGRQRIPVLRTAYFPFMWRAPPVAH